jgi:2-polyprenyl-3-methyl-5-hydroxy-6-metoxy-1,4-benzoquinol methylase
VSLNRYGIAGYYRSRSEYVHYDDTAVEDEWQSEVYLAAKNRMRSEQLRSVLDVGTGSGFKLVNYLAQFETTGTELPQNVDYLRRKYPDRKWIESDLEQESAAGLSSDVIICADVIEHIVDPDQLMQFLNRIKFKYLFLSTPDRGLVYKRFGSSRLRFLRRGYWGPPSNPSHQREWRFDEFRTYVERNFDIMDHRISNREQATQMVICRKKDS